MTRSHKPRPKPKPNLLSDAASEAVSSASFHDPDEGLLSIPPGDGTLGRLFGTQLKIQMAQKWAEESGDDNVEWRDFIRQDDVPNAEEALRRIYRGLDQAMCDGLPFVEGEPHGELVPTEPSPQTPVTSADQSKIESPPGEDVRFRGGWVSSGVISKSDFAAMIPRQKSRVRPAKKKKSVLCVAPAKAIEAAKRKAGIIPQRSARKNGPT